MFSFLIDFNNPFTLAKGYPALKCKTFLEYYQTELCICNPNMETIRASNKSYKTELLYCSLKTQLRLSNLQKN